tara:strand:- start:9 stop:467 length:459 start_codon:yes stop_codon:yes gene_type:complete
MKYDPECPRKRLALQAKVIMTLADAGFDEVSFKGTNERVFARSCHDTDARVLVYTSIEGGETRGRGKDAIRVCAVRPMTDKKERGIVKTMRVNRVGQIDAIAERMLGRMRKAYVQARKVCLVDSPSCNKCGAVQFLSKKGNWVCSNFCWEDK